MATRFAARIRLLEVVFGLTVIAIVVRSAQLQVLQGSRWSNEAEANRRARIVLPAPRGALYDRSGSPLAVTQEYYHLGIAPNEVLDRRSMIRLVSQHLEIPSSRVGRDWTSRRKYLYYHGPFTALQVQPLRRLAGVHLEREFARQYPAGGLARPVIGSLSPDSGTGASGLELALDSLLAGTPGEAVVLKDRAGRRIESPSRLIREPIPGYNVTLTLDAELQEIAERALDDAVTALKAKGGDVVFLDPRTGELLALASRQAVAGELVGTRASAFTDPFEPGSTAKLFTAAALITYRKVDSTDAVDAENGEWKMPIASGQTRTIRDAHEIPGTLTLAEAIQVSSNIAMVKFSLRLRPEEQFEVLRDFGFGSPTGVEFPSESRGRLNRPDRWKVRISGPSIAMGYEFGVTPVQLAAAYGAIANDGILLTPALVKEIHAPNAHLVYRHRPEPVRRAVTPAVASQLRDFLRGAVSEGGTGERAQLVNYSLIGKTGTAKRFEGGRYLQDEYTASFAALFPADDPQLVVIVKIDDPRGEYYGGLTAAPVTGVMLQEALAARQVSIDRSKLMARGEVSESSGDTIAPEAPAASPASVVVVSWPRVGGEPPAATDRSVPDIIGTSARRAALGLHRRGFQVVLQGAGRVTKTWPVAGSEAPAGSTVTVWLE